MKRYGISVDRGGTFTDFVVFRPDGSTKVLKVLSEDPSNYPDAPTEGIRRILEEETGRTIPRGIALPTDEIEWIRMGTTVATNALLERKGEKFALLITKGFNQLLYIGNQSRPKIFDFDIRIPDVLYDRVVEINERIIPEDDTCKMNINGRIEETINGKKMIIEEELDESQVKEQIKQLKDDGIDSIAVLLLHSYIYPNHELIIQRIAKEEGIQNISLSHQVMPMIKVVPRGFTVCADAYLTPKIKDYMQGFEEGFKDGLDNVRVNFMQSDGGLCDVNRFFGSKAILSGPAGGVVGIALTAYDGKKAVIGFDMGGTSTDVCRYSGNLEHVMETTTAGITIQAPQLDIHTVAAGGGSRLFFRNGLFVVGPESSGAHPGPVAYKKNGYLSVTDANIVLGRVQPEFFPKIFGPNADQPLDKEASLNAMKSMTDDINDYLQKEGINKRYSVEEVALGFLAVANEEMCRPIRALTQARGYDTSAHILACFGGAGGQHSCAVAKLLGINQVSIHKYSSVLSAYGIGLANVVSEAQEPAQINFQPDNYGLLFERLNHLSEKTTEDLIGQGFKKNQIQCIQYLHMRFERTDCAIMVSEDAKDESSLSSFKDAFLSAYKREFGFVLENRNIIIDDIRIRGIGNNGTNVNEKIKTADDPHSPPKHSVHDVYFTEGVMQTNVYLLKDLLADHIINGPSMIIDDNSTILIEPNSSAVITKEGNIRMDVNSGGIKNIDTQVDPIRLAIFSNRFMSIAEQMGRVLQRTSISTNIKERLDFSCALFGEDGGLIANAPHIPVHLGGMQYAVKFQIDNIGIDGIEDGDVILSNHPKAGGSHLPDLTVITPVFNKGQSRPVFYLANRGHHADIGGLVPGSMPPNATHISQEGAAFVSFKIVKKGIFQEDELIEELEAPSKIPGCSGTRNLNDNISDLKAQIAANNKGISLVNDLIEEYSLEVVQAYMKYIQSTAEESVRTMLREVGKKKLESSGNSILSSIDYMDDGTIIQLSIHIDIEKGSALFDFNGTGVEVLSSCNTPRAVTLSAIIYCLRCLIGKDIPLNNGCLIPIQIEIPNGSILSPSDDAPVVGGNVLTSQRLCDVILKAFNAVSASQGCMNNVIFGDDTMGYYETIAGGAGAGNGFNGRSGVHTHMTNTRITDPEIFESRYPVILRQFSLRNDSGGNGKWRGGDGVIRKIQFRRPLSLSLLTERRCFRPYGLYGGEDGHRGLNLLIRNGRKVNIGSKITLDVQSGDVLELQTPGGGGYGQIDEGNTNNR